MKNQGHIPEIDALRAISVVLVLVFHAFPAALPGGFIGVDAFFVISGFVIARAYLMPLIKGEVNLRDFYVARFRRLVPAMALLFLVTTVAAISILRPAQLISFSWSLGAQALYLQNFVFWIEGDYFNGALTKPLLHTWSLAVEEQFYIAWALAIWFFRRCPRAVFMTVVLLAAASLAAGFLLEGRSAKTVFFLLPTRIWEFSFGILAYLATLRSGRMHATYSNALALLGVATIVVVAALFDEGSPFPGGQSILACIAASVVLYCFDRSDGPLHAFRGSPLLYVGRISYGLYLWHWPPLVFFYMQTGRQASAVEAAGLMVFALFAAHLSYHLLENPIRRNTRWWPTSKILSIAAGASIGVVFAFLVILRTDGFLFLYPKVLQPLLAAPQERGQFRCDRLYVLQNPRKEFCPLGEGSGTGGVLLLGDSHADVVKEVVAEVGAQLSRPVYLTVRNCDLGRYGSYAFCSRRVLVHIVEQARAAGVTDVIAASRWEPKKFDVESLRTDLGVLVEAGLRVHVMHTVPHDRSYDPSARAQLALSGGPLHMEGMALAKYRESTRAEREILEEVIGPFGEGASLLRPADYFCSAGHCAWQRDGVPYYFDADHLTFTGAEVLRPMFVGLLSRENVGAHSEP